MLRGATEELAEQARSNVYPEPRLTDEVNMLDSVLPGQEICTHDGH
jgi:hypothetical protein